MVLNFAVGIANLFADSFIDKLNHGSAGCNTNLDFITTYNHIFEQVILED